MLGTGAVAAAERAILDLEVFEDLPVYAKPNSRSVVISRLSRGDRVVVSPQIYGSFRKVLVTARGRPTAGYVPIRKIVRSQIRERGAEEGLGTYSSRYSLGLAFVPAYMRQGESAFQLSDGSTYDTTVFSGTSYFFSLFMDMPISPRWGVRPYISFRETSLKGTTTRRDDPPGVAAKKITREQSLTGLGLVLKRYTSENSSWWWGGGAEIAVGSKVAVKISSVPVPTSDEDKPFFLMGFLAMGADFSLMKSIYFVPDLRLGMIGTTQPMTIYAESFLGLAYLF